MAVSSVVTVTVPSSLHSIFSRPATGRKSVQTLSTADFADKFVSNGVGSYIGNDESKEDRTDPECAYFRAGMGTVTLTSVYELTPRSTLKLTIKLVADGGSGSASTMSPAMRWPDERSAEPQPYACQLL
jgi:hypothetical protein